MPVRTKPATGLTTLNGNSFLMLFVNDMRMKRVFNYKMALVALLLVGSMSACQKKVSVSFGGQMENVQSIDSSGAKTYLSHAEEWVLWEAGDEIRVVEGTNTDYNDFRIVSGEGSLYAFFRGEATEGSKKRYAFSPKSLYKTRSGDVFTITLPAEQPYRTVADPATDPDHSFAPNVLPMVSFANSSLEDLEFYFHPVCGIMRLQFFRSAATEVTINSIDIESKDMQLSGDFTLKASNAIGSPVIEDPEPFVQPKASPSEADKKVTITGINQTIGGSQSSNLCTFYVPLPSTKDLTANVSTNTDGSMTQDTYTLLVTVHGTQSGNPVKCSKALKVNIHRSNLTMLRALDLTTWVHDDGNSTIAGSVDVSLVGCGTKDRPFQIYTADDLVRVRNAFSSANPTVNGQPVVGYDPDAKVEPTYFKITRSDIVLMTQAAYDALDDSDPLQAAVKAKAAPWTSGINNFKGVMYFATSAAYSGGITNNSDQPLFQSVSANGRLEEIYVKGTMSNLNMTTDIFSPLCHTNNGYIIDCHNRCNVSVSASSASSKYLAGICAINNNVIEGGANDANLSTSTSNVAGICYRNNASGKIMGSFALSRAVPSGVNIAGVCFENYGLVKDCLISSNVNPVRSSGNWGVIVFENKSGATVENCRSAGALVYTTTGSIGGICHTNYGTVCNSSNTVTLVGASGSIGGVVAVQEAGEIYNCDSEGDHYIEGSTNNRTADNAGGIVGWLKGGTVKNCYNHCRVGLATNSGGVVGRVEMPSYTSTRPLENCWSGYGHKFKGTTSDTICKMGKFCFSATYGDFDTINGNGCNIFSNVTYKITNLHQGPNTLSYIDMSGYGLSDTPGEESYLVDALNYWVNNVSGNTSKYWQWVVPDGEVMPRLHNPNNPWVSKMRQRRTSSKRR